ncbi:putative nucleotide-diphospho-sugar transferase [Amaricoccus sp. W119]|uniref:putative nucleotide-diphospho-sugar transferase n=1 Tax=Amaricoccus sp. W119 TaxID=3391833 RepID=UPI0039A5A4EA
MSGVEAGDPGSDARGGDAPRVHGPGVVYVATGAAHIEAARASAASVRRTNPKLGLAIFADSADVGPEFDIVEPVAGAHVRSKIDYLPRTPFAETLYLDTDTRVLGDLGELFRLLDRFPVAAAHRVRDTERVLNPREYDPVPSSFPEHNGGVLLYRSSPEVLAFFTAWRDEYHRAGFVADQISFRRVLWATDLRVAVLPPRFNTRRYTWVDRFLSRQPPPVILHANRFHPSKRGGPIRRRLQALLGPAI